MAAQLALPRASVQGPTTCSTNTWRRAASQLRRSTPCRSSHRRIQSSGANQWVYRRVGDVVARMASSNEVPSMVAVEETGAELSEEDEKHNGPAKETAATPPIGRSRKQLWKAAVKLPMYSVALVPLMVGTAVAFSVGGVASAAQFFGVLLASVLVIAWLNLSNDAFDADTGVDTAKPESVVNLLGGRKGLVLVLANAALGLGVGLMAISMASVTDSRVFAWLAAAVACGYVYQGPPFRLSYKGLGEPLCFLAFGPLATGAFFLAQMSAASAPTNTPPILWVCATVVGLTTTSILFCSHFHQSGAFTCGCAYVPLYKAAFTVGGLILVVSTGFLFTFLVQGDLAAGKMSPLVRLGTLRAATVLKLSVWGTYALLAGAAAVGAVPLIAVVACALSLPAAHSLVRYVDINHAIPSKIMTSKLTAINWHIALGFCLCVGLIVARLQPSMTALLL